MMAVVQFDVIQDFTSYLVWNLGDLTEEWGGDKTCYLVTSMTLKKENFRLMSSSWFIDFMACNHVQIVCSSVDETIDNGNLWEVAVNISYHKS